MTRPVPAVTGFTAPYWAAVGEGVLRMPVCTACGHRFFPPEPACPVCRAEPGWEASAGLGTVYSVTVVHRRPALGFEVPFALALVELDEGWILMTHVVGVPPERVRIGDRVELHPERAADDPLVHLPCFRPLGAPERKDLP